MRCFIGSRRELHVCRDVLAHNDWSGDRRGNGDLRRQIQPPGGEAQRHRAIARPQSPTVTRIAKPKRAAITALFGVC